MTRIVVFVIAMVLPIFAMAGPTPQKSSAKEKVSQTHDPEVFVKSLKGDPKAGKKVYEFYCATCHAQDPEIEMGAPHIGVLSEWKPRMKIGLDGLLKVTENGVNNMPARGGCFECSDHLLKQAIVYMLPKSLKPKNAK